MQVNRKTLLVILIVFSVIVIICGSCYMIIFSNYQGSSSTRTGIFTGLYPDEVDEIRVDYFELDINPQKHRAILGFSITCFKEGNYSVTLSLPFRIESSENLGVGTWHIRNAVLGSVVMVTFEAKNSSVDWNSLKPRIKLHTKDSIDNRSFETHSISLAFGSSYSLDIKEKIEELREISPISGRNPFNGIVVVALSQTAFITTTTHQIERIDPATDTEYQAYEFRINDAKPFYLQYIDSEERSNFEMFLLLSGAIFGAVFGVVASKLCDITMPLIASKFRNARARDTKMANHNEPKKVAESPEDQILSLIRLIDSEKDETFKYFDEFHGIRFPLGAFLLVFALVLFVTVFLAESVIQQITIGVAFFAFMMGFFSFFSKFFEENKIDASFDRLKKYCDEDEKPLLKALIKIKAKNKEFDLEQIYNMNPDMFTLEKILTKLYE